MSSNFDEIIANLKNYETNKSYLEYIKYFAPQYASCMSQYVRDLRVSYESDKHKDVDKYLYDPFISYSENFGKLHRPLTCIAAYLACSNENYEELKNVFAVAGSIELFQTAALIHDDIADDGQMRRGKECLHKVIGDGLAINTGDFGLSATIGMLIQQLGAYYDDGKLMKIISKLVFMEYMTIEGQAMDLGWARDNRFDITEDDYFVMATKKTAYYSGSVPCVLAAICSNADDKTTLALQDYGKKVGLAFQIQDDLLNLIGDDEVASQKDFRSDIVEGKRTLVVCKTLELCDNKDKNTLIDILKSDRSDKDFLNLAVDIMKKCGAIDYAKDYATKLCEEAYETLDNALEDSKWKSIMLGMSSWAKERQI